MPGKGVKLYLARYWTDTEEERRKERKNVWQRKRKRCAAFNARQSGGWGTGSERTTIERHRMSEKERNRASRLKNKCELIRPQEAFYITSAPPCFNVLQRLFCVRCVCVFMVQKRSFSLPETTVYICVCIYAYTHICELFLKALWCVMFLRLCVFEST